MPANDRIIYTPTAFARQNLFYLQELGTLQAQSPHTSKRTDLDSFLFFAVKSGSGFVGYNGAELPLHAGDCVFLDCRQSYYHRTSDDLWEISWLHFNGPSLPGVFEKYTDRGGKTVFHPAALQDYLTCYENLHKIAQEDSPVRDMLLNRELSSLLVFLMQEAFGDHPTQKKSSLADIKRYLDTNYRQKITLDDLAERFYINKFYLTRIFKEAYGVSINSYLLSVRVTAAKQALRFTNKPMDQIGQETGIGPGYYFSRVFTRLEGMSPMEYRKQWKG